MGSAHGAGPDRTQAKSARDLDPAHTPVRSDQGVPSACLFVPFCRVGHELIEPTSFPPKRIDKGVLLAQPFALWAQELICPPVLSETSIHVGGDALDSPEMALHASILLL